MAGIRPTGDLPGFSNSWKIASYASFVVIAGFILWNILSRDHGNGIDESIDKSIAVLPFTSLSDEPEFQQIVRDVEAKYQAKHERVKQWLEQNDML